MIRVPRGYVVCECVRGKPNRELLSYLAGLPLEDFAMADDQWRAERGLPPYVAHSRHD